MQKYPYGKVHDPEGGPQSAVMDGHDSRGTADWIKAIQEDPEILAPMAKS